MTWVRGEETIRRLLDSGELEQVRPAPAVAERLMNDADAHVALGRRGIDDQADPPDPVGALQLAYDAARKASAALLATQGLRSTTRGGHIAILEAVREQFNGPKGVAVFGRTDRLRRRRHDAEYPDAASPGVTREDAAAALDHAAEVVAATRQLLRTAGSTSSSERTPRARPSPLIHPRAASEATPHLHAKVGRISSSVTDADDAQFSSATRDLRTLLSAAFVPKSGRSARTGVSGPAAPRIGSYGARRGDVPRPSQPEHPKGSFKATHLENRICAIQLRYLHGCSHANPCAAPETLTCQKPFAALLLFYRPGSCYT